MNEELLNGGSAELTVNEKCKAEMLTAAKWAKFLCIMGCIAMGIMLLCAILLIALGSALGSFLGIHYGSGVGFLYLVIALIYIYPIIKGFQFANATKVACLSDDEQQLARGMEGLSSLLKFFGILTIICIVLYLFIFLFAGAAAVMLKG